MLAIGLTGGIACGKSTAAQTLRGLGAPVFDADAVSRALTARGGEAAPEVLARFGTLDRKQIAAEVFSNPAALRDLNAIVHPRVQIALERFLADCRARGEKAAVLDVPLLYEAGLDRLADRVWVLHVPRDEQARRVMARDGATLAQAQARIDAQMPLCEKCRRADVCVDTFRPGEETQRDIAALWQKTLAEAGATA